ncbi:hypothetical protein D8674_042062 [Pyrus ussuriensis x Pyrus communis]|uniref:Uncharacterized protein n=1 Tax=Pyrus ussuriensis x Pyrus communis TaxID=2448454 RepID=A0A5N5H6V6_9ROSA|nr:hypothetical protein D8674_042062 [Pyrus ussuriensis x Pyrus communis]
MSMKKYLKKSGDDDEGSKWDKTDSECKQYRSRDIDLPLLVRLLLASIQTIFRIAVNPSRKVDRLRARVCFCNASNVTFCVDINNIWNSIHLACV